MNVQDFTYLLQHPDQIVSSAQTMQLAHVIDEYPYFQTARALHLKGLKNANSFKYNDALKVTAAYTTDRDILFDFITSEEFLQNKVADTILDKDNTLTEKEVISEDISVSDERPKEFIVESEDNPLPRSSEDASQILDPELFRPKDPMATEQLEEEKATKTLELGQPLVFTKNERHSFSEWLQLTSLKTVSSDTEVSESDSRKVVALSKKKKYDLIDKFLDKNPKIVPQEENTPEIDIAPSGSFNKNELMTETLAKVYLEQKKYEKAAQAYKILSLKYPEKSGFFADRIRAIEKIQRENSEEQ